MIDEVKKDVLKILEEAMQACKEGDYVNLREISNHTIHNVSIFQDEDSIAIAVIIFSIYKISARSGAKEKGVCNVIVSSLTDAYELLKMDRIEEYKQAVKKIFKTIAETDRGFRLYIEEVINQAEIKKGSKVYEHGVSIARAAQLLGISQWELMNYVGKTMMPPAEVESFDVRDRIIFAKKLFGV